MTLRIAYVDHIEHILAGFHKAYPEIVLDITISDSITDIVAHGFDLGTRLGELLEEELVAVRLGGTIRQLAVASPDYLAKHRLCCWGIGYPIPPATSVDHLYWFIATVSPKVERTCAIVGPLYHLLLKRPELSKYPLQAGDWTKLIQAELGDAQDGIKPLGYGAIGRCLRIHRKLLERNLVITRSENPTNPAGHLYQLARRDDVDVDLEQLCPAA